MNLSDLQMRDAFLEELHRRAKNDPKIVLVTNDQGAAALDGFHEELPGQFINAGISEQNILSVSAGMALEGKKVFVYSIASFITLRSFEQIKIDLCAMDLGVTILGVGAGYSYSTDGPTHHATEDIAIMRTLDNMTIYSPSDSYLAAALVDISLKSSSPLYIRLDREKQPPLYDESTQFNVGFNVFGEPAEICIVSTGCMVKNALKVSSNLNRDLLSTKVIDVYKLKPIDKVAFVHALRGGKNVFTLEEHSVNGGLGSIVSEIITDSGLGLPLKRFAIREGEVFAYGIRDGLHKDRGLDVDSVESCIRNNVR